MVLRINIPAVNYDSERYQRASFRTESILIRKFRLLHLFAVLIRLFFSSIPCNCVPFYTIEIAVKLQSKL